MRSGQQSKDLGRAEKRQLWVGCRVPGSQGLPLQSGVPPSSGAPARGAELSLLFQSPLLAPCLTGQVLLTKPGECSIPTGNLWESPPSSTSHRFPGLATLTVTFLPYHCISIPLMKDQGPQILSDLSLCPFCLPSVDFLSSLGLTSP